jgi:3-oxoacyl-[acyl-carrier protein] reductase
MLMLLEGKTAVIYGGGGSIGGAVARVFAREGARVCLAGRTAEKLHRVAAEIASAGGSAETAVLNALDSSAVDSHADALAARTDGIDISLNVIAIQDVQGTAMAEMRVEDYMRPVQTAVRTQFLTWRAAARHMKQQGGGVILAFGGEGHPPRGHHLGGLQTAFHAVEAMRRQLSTEYGQYGIRVVTLRTGGVPGSIPESLGERREQLARSLTDATLLGRTATPEDVGNTAAAGGR